MNATELFHQDGHSAGVFYCATCRRVDRTKEDAESCCTPRKCSKCGEVVDRGWTTCHDCQKIEAMQREIDRFAKAEKVTQWDGFVYLEGIGNDGFCPVSELDDYIEMAELEKGPEYVWTCDPVPFAHVSLDDILQGIEEDGDSYEDFDSATLDGIPELKTAIEAFNAANAKVVSYSPNYGRALILK